MMKPTIPIVMLNGSGRGTLLTGYRTEIDALQRAIRVMGRNAPHGRDFEDAETWRLAVQEHRARISAVAAVLDEITTIAVSIAR